MQTLLASLKIRKNVGQHGPGTDGGSASSRETKRSVS